ncbi:MAG TPA: protein kinase, partial [Terriglobales bacterium]
MATTPSQINRLYGFGSFRLDPHKRLLLSGNEPVSLTPKVIDTLIVLVENRDRVVSKDELMKVLWPDSFVEESNLSQNIFVLRKALGDSQERRFILTVSGKGYRFVADVEEIASVPASAAPISSDSLIGKKVSHYRIIQVLGGGGMGVVYKAEDLKLGRRVALKFLPSELANDPRALDRIQGEARAASSLDHPNICAIYELGEHETQPFIVMQLLEGETLREWIESSPAIISTSRVEELLKIAGQITEGLQAAHQKGIVHRDIKPSNIFITNRGEAKILDFGVAKFFQTDVPDAVAESSATVGTHADVSLTQTGDSMGTPSYLSPEQIRGEKLDARTDLFSFGLVLYEMATGKQTYSGKTAADIRNAVLNLPPVRARQLNPEIPPELERIIDKTLEKDLDRRYQNASDLRADLLELSKRP